MVNTTHAHRRKPGSTVEVMNVHAMSRANRIVTAASIPLVALADDGYVKAVAAAARQLVTERFLLQEDADRYVEAAKASDVLR